MVRPRPEGEERERDKEAAARALFRLLAELRAKRESLVRQLAEVDIQLLKVQRIARERQELLRNC